MAGGAGQQAARRIALVVEPQAPRRYGRPRFERQPGIIERHRLAFVGIQRPRNPAHLRVIAPAIGIGFELALQIAGVQPGQPRRARPVAAPAKPVAGEAGIARAGLRPAERDEPAVFREPVKRGRLARRTARQQGRDSQMESSAHVGATVRSPRLFRRALFAPLLLLLTAACKPPPDQRQLMPVADAAHGRAVIERAGCGSCHMIPGVGWPQGKVGPSLHGLAERGLIAGKLPNRPDVLAAYIRNAPALVPGSAMPAMPVSEAEARDIAAFLYEQGS